jgi:hypothetical protein
MTIEYPKHAVVQLDTGAVYGIGDDLAHARADALAEFRRAHIDDVEAAMDGCTDARISEAAAAYVADHGGAPSHDLVFGRIPYSHTPAIHLRSEEE